MPILDKSNVKEVKEYEEFTKKSQYTHAMQDMRWAKIKNNWENDYVYIKKDNKIVAGLSVLAIKAQDDKSFLYAPRGPICDFYDVQLVKELIDEASPLFKKYNAFLLRIDPCIKYDKNLIEKYKKLSYEFRSEGVNPHSFSNPRYEMILDIELKTEEQIMAGFNSMTKRHIKSSIKDGLISRYSRESDYVDIFFELTKIMAERKGITYRPKNYFQRLIDAYLESRIYVCEHNNENVCAMIGLPYGNTMWYIYGATKITNINIYPGYFIIWELIKWAKQLGLKYFNMGGIYSLDIKDDLFFFKHGFCKSNEPYIYIGELDVVIDKETYDKFIKA